MGTIILNWLDQKLGINIDSENIGAQFKDGTLLFKLLKSYNIVNPECEKTLFTKGEPGAAYKNMRQLSVWLKLLGLNISDAMLKDISEDKNLACIRLLHELYICLQVKEKFYFISKENVPHLLHCPGTIFKVKNMSNQVDEKNRMAELFNKKCVEMIEKCKSSNKKRRFKLIKEFPTEAKEETENCGQGNEAENTRREINDFMQRLPRRAQEETTNYAPEDYITILRSKKKVNVVDNEIKLKKHSILLGELWDNLLKTQEEEFGLEFSRKLLHQSEYEKEMVERLCLLQYEQKIILKNALTLQTRFQYEEEIKSDSNVSCESFKQRKNKKEEKKVMELHRKLYYEKLQNEFNLIRALCQTTVEGIIDFSMKIIEFKMEYGTEAPRRLQIHWKELFYTSQPLFPEVVSGAAVIPEEVIITPSVSEFELGRLDNSVELQRSKSSIDSTIKGGETRHITIATTDEAKLLSETESMKCMYDIGSWDEAWSSEPEHKVMRFIVARLLGAKYPLLHPSHAPLRLPHSVRAVVNGLTDSSAIQKLKIILRKPSIEVFDVPSAIDYAVSAFQEDAADTLEEEIQEEILGEYDEALNQSRISLEKIDVPQKKHFGAQFPSIPDIPQIPATVSKAPSLGKEIFELLTAGEPIPDSMLVEVVGEYIKSFENVNGWVLLNFPFLESQARLMESLLTGVEFPFGPKAPEKDPEKDKLLQLRTSKLFPPRRESSEASKFKSYFTRFISLKQQISNTCNGSAILDNKFEMEETNPNGVYERIGILYEFSYTSMDIESLLRLARVIILDEPNESVEGKSNEELFGYDALNLFSAKRKSKVYNTSSSQTGKMHRRKTVSGRESFESDFKRRSLNERGRISMALSENEHRFEASVKNSIEEITSNDPNSPNWNHIDAPINKEIEISLATFWESVENVYMEKLESTTFSLREISNKVFLYRKFINETIHLASKEPEEKQKLVSKFQEVLNNIPKELRMEIHVKVKLYSLLFELECRLMELNDEERKKSEERRLEVISQNYLSELLKLILNTYCNLCQVEVDRFVGTLQLLQDYFRILLRKPLTGTKLDKIHIPKIKTSDTTSYSVGLEDGHEEKKTSSEKNQISTVQMLSLNTIDRLTKHILSSEPSKKEVRREEYIFLRDTFSEIFNLANAEVERLSEYFNSIINLERNIDHLKEPNDFVGTGVEDFILPEVELEKFKFRCLREWESALTDENSRIFNRLSTILTMALRDFTVTMNEVEGLFYTFSNDIITIYHNNIRNVQSLCKFLKASIEAAEKIELSITFEPGLVRINESLNLFPPVIPPPPTPLTNKAFSFTIQQLTDFMVRMKFVAPLGIMKEAFIDILQDMTIFPSENGNSYLPEGWSCLSRENISCLLQLTFGDACFIDWKDFLIFALNIPFPSVHEILEARDQFLALDQELLEIISYENFKDIEFWFEKYLGCHLLGDLQVVIVKEFLFQLFQVNENNINYTKFLLAFCKDFNPVDGFLKGLVVISGFKSLFDNAKKEVLAPWVATSGDIFKGQMMEQYQIFNNPKPEESTNASFINKSKTDDGIEIPNAQNTTGERLSKKLTIEWFPQNATHDELSRKSTRESFSQNTTVEDGNEKKRWSQPSLGEHEAVGDFDPEEEIIENMNDDVIQHDTTPYNLALATLTLGLCLHDDEQLKLEKGLSELYETNGKGGVIETLALVKSEFIFYVCAKFPRFKSCEITESVQMLLEQKQ